MAVLLGIDTGGTYTDAVLFDEHTGVRASAKALTTKHDLSVGIRQAMAAVLPDPRPEIRMVSLSTTLATNAIVEAHGSPICLLLLGYPEDVLEQEGLRRALAGNPVIFAAGGHTVSGDEQAPLDEEAIREAIRANAPKVSAFAISGYFAVRNPSHELRARRLVHELSGLPVTCGHELTSSLHAPRRALTAALNARLIPLLHQLILAVQEMLAEKGIRAPLMVVKGDGSLVAARMALERPVETILSGPAASVVGARYLSGQGDVFVVDMGGTTTDIALLRGGTPVLNEEGATVGGWRTMVQAVSVHTFGLGGDSEVRLDERGHVQVGPRRIVPLSLLAHQRPEVLEVLRRQLGAAEPGTHDGCFALRQRTLNGAAGSLSGTQLEVWGALADGPVALSELLSDPERGLFRGWALGELVERGLVIAGGFTPSDAAHVLGHQRHWSLDAAQLGAALWARRAAASRGETESDARAFCEGVMRQVTVQSGRALVATALAEAHGVALDGKGTLSRILLDRSLGGSNGDDPLLDVTLSLRRPLVAVGAPVETFYPEVAKRLNTGLAIPEHAGIANAVGAVAGGVAQTVRALVKPYEQDGVYRAHLPSEIRDFGDLEEAVSWATAEAVRLAEEQARRAGAAEVQVHATRKDHIGPTRDGDVHFETDVIATAVGRPGLG